MTPAPPQPPREPSLSRRAWTALGEAVTTRPGVVTLAGLVLSLAAVAAAVWGLEVRQGYVDLLSPRSPTQARYLALLEDFGNVETLHVVVTSDDPAVAGRFVDRFARAVAAARDAEGRPLAAAVVSRVDLAWFLDHLPAYLPSNLLATAASEPAASHLRSFVQDPHPAALLAAMDQGLRAAAEEAGAGRVPTDAGGLAALTDVLRAVAVAARGGSSDPAAWLGSWAARDRERLLDHEGHVRVGERSLLVVVTPAERDNDFEPMARFLDAVRGAADESAAGLPGAVSVEMTGAPVLLVDEMRAVRRDATRSSVVALALVTALYALSFKPLRHVLAAVAAGLAGLALAFGAAWLLVGYLNLFSVVFAAILIGLGLDYGIHLVNFHAELAREGIVGRVAIVRCLQELGPPTALGAVTTAAAFLATTSSEFAGFAQLGLIAGVGVLLCLATAVTLLPALLELDRRRLERAGRAAGSAAPGRTRRSWSSPLLAAALARPGATLLVGGFLAALAAVGATRVRFDYDLLNLQPSGTRAVALQREPEGLRVATHVAYSLTDDVETARDLAIRFEALPTVGAARSVADVLPQPDAGRGPALERLAALLDGHGPSPQPGPVDVELVNARAADLRATLTELQDRAFDAGEDGAVAELDGALAAVGELEAALAAEGAAAHLGRLRESLAKAVERSLGILPELARRPITPADLPGEIRAPLVGASGRLAVIVEPARPAWMRPALEAFAADLRTVDPDVTGPPLQILEVTETMRRSLELAAVLAFGAIVVLVVVTLRSAAGSVAALAPVVAGFLVMLGLMGWADVPLNPANLVALPLLLGIGVDSGLHVTHRWLVERDARRAVADVGHAVVVTSLTTLAGFAGLLVASHRGIRSLGVLASLGTCAMLFTSVVLLPAALRCLEGRRS